MSLSMKYYVQFGIGIVIGNMIIGLLDEAALSIQIVVKAVLAALLAVGLLAWLERRKSRRVER